MLLNDVSDQISNAGFTPISTHAYGLFVRGGERMRHFLQRHIRTLACFPERSFAAAAVIDAERLENWDAPRVLDGNFANRLINIGFYSLDL